jgi:hypothetical protein
MLHLLGLGPSRTNMDLLRREMEKIAAQLPEHTPTPTRAAEIPEDLPEQLRRIMKEAFKREYFLFLTQLRSDNQKDREAAAKEIVEQWNEKIAPITNQVQYYEKHGALPADHYLIRVEKPMTDVERYKRIQNLRSQISKNRTRADRQADVATWEAEIKHLEMQINGTV